MGERRILRFAPEQAPCDYRPEDMGWLSGFLSSRWARFMADESGARIEVATPPTEADGATFLPAVEHVAELTGSGIARTANGWFYTAISGDRALAVLKELLPWVGLMPDDKAATIRKILGVGETVN